MGKINLEIIEKQLQKMQQLSVEEKINNINQLKLLIKKYSPFFKEPVDCIIWVPKDDVKGNEYNPNKVAPPEMRLLECSIEEDGYTQPIVAWKESDKYEIVDGFHRNRVGKECKDISARIHGYLPLAIINDEKTGKAERIASTIRHNRARGKHSVDAMSEIVLELKNRNWKNTRIAKELGMDEEEILRLTQISGLENMFTNEEFSKAWIADEDDYNSSFTDDINDEEADEFRTVNTSDPDRIFHTFDKWECYKAGFFATSKEGMTKEECENLYAEFLKNDEKFKEALEGVITNWKYSCEHYLTNKAMNRIAWLGQASACYSIHMPSAYRGGFNLLTEEEKERANNIALEYLNKWLVAHNMNPVTYEEGLGGTERQVELY